MMFWKMFWKCFASELVIILQWMKYVGGKNIELYTYLYVTIVTSSRELPKIIFEELKIFFEFWSKKNHFLNFAKFSKKLSYCIDEKRFLIFVFSFSSNEIGIWQEFTFILSMKKLIVFCFCFESCISTDYITYFQLLHIKGLVLK